MFLQYPSIWFFQNLPVVCVSIDFYLGGVPHLINLEIIHNPTKAKEERNRLFTEAVGRIHLRLDVMLRHVKEHNVVL